MVEVGEFQRIAHEENRRVVADQVPVAFLGIEFQCKTANIALGIGCAALTGHGAEAHKQIGLLADCGENLGSRVLGDVMRYCKGTIST